MILPFFHHLLNPRRFPVTILLILLNVGLYCAINPLYSASQDEVEKVISDDDFLDAQARIFAQMILATPTHYAAPLAKLAAVAQKGDSSSLQVLGRLSLRNAEFMDRAPAFAFKGDHILYRNWQDQFARFADLRAIHPNYLFGFSSLTPGYEPYVTYQFLHGGSAHLLVNMSVLLLVGSVVEPLLGGAWFLLLYLICGVGAAVGFQLLSGSTPVPLVGASGSIMGLFGLLLALRWREPLRFVWLLPTSSYAGYIFLPVWIFVCYLILSDVAGFIETESWMGTGIAHAAHLGGFAVGALLGLVIRLFHLAPPPQPNEADERKIQLQAWFPSVQSQARKN